MAAAGIAQAQAQSFAAAAKPDAASATCSEAGSEEGPSTSAAGSSQPVSKQTSGGSCDGSAEVPLPPSPCRSRRSLAAVEVPSATTEGSKQASGSSDVEEDAPLPPGSPWVLPAEVLLFEPGAAERFRGGQTASPAARLIFGGARLLDVEAVALRALRQALDANGQVAAADHCPGDEDEPEGSDRVALPQAFVEALGGPQALRLLQHCQYDVPATLKLLAKLASGDQIADQAAVHDDLQHAFIYWHGRDRSCRPCLVIRFDRAGPIVDEPARAARLVAFVLEYAVKNALVPGRVENWVVMLDLANALSAVTSPWAITGVLSTAMQLVELLESAHCGRLAWIKLLNLPGGWWLRSLVNGAIPAAAKEKVSCPEGAKELLEQFEPHQLENCYGGSAQDVEPGAAYPFRFFPMQEPAGADLPCSAEVAGEAAGDEAYSFAGCGFRDCP